MSKHIVNLITFGCFVAACTFFLVSCGLSGSRTTLVMRKAKYPVSMSRAVRDENGALVRLKKIKRVGIFETEFSAWSILYGSIPFSAKTDISEQINRQVENVGGDAVTNVLVTVNNCKINEVPFFSLLPIWPGCLDAKVQGTIIKVRDDS